MACLQRRHWTEPERCVLVEGLMSGVLAEQMHPDAVPPDVLRRLPGRSSESVRQYLKRHASALMGSVLECDEMLGSLMGQVSGKKRRGRPSKLDKEVQQMLESVAPVPPMRSSVPLPPSPLLQAIEEEPPPEMSPPLPRAMTTNAKRVRLDAYGFVSSYTLELPRSSFEDMNKKLGMHRDARTENWDGLPRFM